MFYVVTSKGRVSMVATFEHATFEADLATEAGAARWAMVTDACGSQIQLHTARSVTVKPGPYQIPA